MYNSRLAQRSETFEADDGTNVEKRCFFLMSGEDDYNTNAFEIRMCLNIFDEPRATQKIDA